MVAWFLSFFHPLLPWFNLSIEAAGTPVKQCGKSSLTLNPIPLQKACESFTFDCSNEKASSTFEKSFYKKSSQVSFSVPDLWLYGIGTMNCPWHCWYHESHRSGHIPFFLWIPISPSHYEQITLSVALRHMGESPVHLSFKFSIFLLRMFSYSSVLNFLVF